jgi:large subunit ribosomal protein L21
MDMYAVIKTGGKQHRVSEGELLTVEKLDGGKGDSVVFDNVLMVAKEGEIRVGTPVVEGAKVVGEIVAQTKGPKIYVFKRKRRKGFHKKTGHRQQLTQMRIKEISL